MCIFCKIIQNELPANKVYEDENVVAFTDINPLAPVHIVVVPKECRLYFHELTGDNIQHLHHAIIEIVKEQGLIEKGYRLVNNNGEHGGQTVAHAHIHILAGEVLGHHLAG